MKMNKYLTQKWLYVKLNHDLFYFQFLANVGLKTVGKKNARV